MSVPAAYLGIVLIWSSTPLAIQWSTEAGFIYSVTVRLALGLALAVIVLRCWGKAMRWDKTVRGVCLVSGASIYLSMISIYWASQHIPSGWIAVIFGLMPIMTAVLSNLFLNENSLTAEKLFGMLLGVAGLALVFISGQKLGELALLGVLAILFGTLMQSCGAVWVKRLNTNLSGLEVNVGGLMFAVPCFVTTGIFADIDWTPEVSQRGVLAIGYLAVIGSALGFSLYFYVLKHVSATRVSLIALVTPVITLILGSWLNGEPVVPMVWVGTALIGTGLLSFEVKSGSAWLKRRWT